MHPAVKIILIILKKKPKVTLAGAAALLLIVSMFLSRSSILESSNEQWAEVTKDVFIDQLVESGTIQAVDAELIRVPRIWNMEFQIVSMEPEGNLVKKGDFLLQFDTSSLEEELSAAIDQLKQAEAELKSIETQQASTMSELETNLQIAEFSKEAAKLQVELLKFESKNTQEEARLDYEKELISYDETEKKIENQKIIHRAEHLKAELAYKQQKANVEEIERQIEGLTLKAPIDGMVVYNEIGGRGSDNPSHKPLIGDKVDPGEAVMSIPDLSQMHLILQVNEMDASRVRTGLDVTLRLDAYEDTEYHGKIIYKASLIEKDDRFWRNAKQAPPSFQVTVLIDESDMMLKPGMTAQAVIDIEQVKNQLLVPIGAVFELADGSTVVFPKKHYPDAKPVEIVKRNDLYAVVSGELKEGDKLSWHTPENGGFPLGWFAEMERRRMEHRQLVGHIDTMNERGLTFDPARADSITAKNNAANAIDMPPASGSATKVQ